MGQAGKSNKMNNKSSSSRSNRQTSTAVTGTSVAVPSTPTCTCVWTERVRSCVGTAMVGSVCRESSGAGAEKERPASTSDSKRLSGGDASDDGKGANWGRRGHSHRETKWTYNVSGKYGEMNDTSTRSNRQNVHIKWLLGKYAIQFYDRFAHVRTCFPKQRLQLLGKGHHSSGRRCR